MPALALNTPHLSLHLAVAAIESHPLLIEPPLPSQTNPMQSVPVSSSLPSSRKPVNQPKPAFLTMAALKQFVDFLGAGAGRQKVERRDFAKNPQRAAEPVHRLRHIAKNMDA